jgi:stearoyl-CoA desaturase (delta-9 desaturase)
MLRADAECAYSPPNLTIGEPRVEQTAASFADRCLWRLGWLHPLSPLRVKLAVLAGVAGFHALALLACLPWLFSWSGLAWAVGGIYLFGMLGINIGFHRLLTHRGFTCPLWLEHGLAILGACCWQNTPLHWVSVHRMHHQHSDEDKDPHSPKDSFFWSHMGWFLMHDPAIYNRGLYLHYARDLLQDRFYTRFERPPVWFTLHAAQWSVFLVAGAAFGGLMTGTIAGAVQLGLSWLVWGVFVRMVGIWHITWSVNSLTHMWGYRSFNTRDDSRNNWLVAMLANGEGWHNNHHAQPRCAAHGRSWWEFDISYITIRAFGMLGLAHNIIGPREWLDQEHDEPQQRRLAA